MLICGQIVFHILKKVHVCLQFGTKIGFETVLLGLVLLQIKMHALFYLNVGIQALRVIYLCKFGCQLFQYCLLIVYLLIWNLFYDLRNNGFKILNRVDWFLKKQTHQHLSITCFQKSILFLHEFVDHFSEPIAALSNWLHKVPYFLLKPVLPLFSSPFFVKILN